MGPPADGNIFAILLGLVALTALLVIIGFVLRRRGKLNSRGAAFVWACVCMLPLFGAGAFMFTKHTVEQATGETRSGVNEEPGRDPR